MSVLKLAKALGISARRMRLLCDAAWKANEPSGQVSSDFGGARGCPCGCRSTRWYDDAECIRNEPLPAARDWPAIDVRDLGLEPHDRSHCGRCSAVAAEQAALSWRSATARQPEAT